MNTYLILDPDGVVVDSIIGTRQAAFDAADHWTRSTMVLHTIERVERVTELRAVS